MTTRAEIEGVLFRHQIICAGEDCNGTGKDTHCPTIVNDLLACYPQSSREELKKLIDRLLAFNLAIPSSSSDNTEFWFWKKKELVDEVMAWAHSKPRREWCPDIVWDTKPDIVTTEAHWCFRREGEKEYQVPAYWNLCPICGTARPSDE